MIYCIVGPTACGKSELALYLAKKINGLIINFDAFQIYKDMNIGTAKPTDEEIIKYNMKLFNIINIDEVFDVSKYQKMARKLIDEYKDQNLIFVGGTGLFLKAVLFDYKFNNEPEMPKDFLSNLTNEELYNKLLKIDKEDALKIGPNNRKRLIRALYIYKIHGINKTSLNNNGKNTLLYDCKIYGINYPRDILNQRIEKRVEIMFKSGLRNEVEDIFKNHNCDSIALKAIGYKEFLESNNDKEIKQLIIQNTKKYAKRQVTFFKNQFNNIVWFNNLEEGKIFLNEEFN
ncbi:MAG: tRNA (adenosine(37)-N6)-dimethylallyltransferase MiaA [Bacillales bacterium]